MESRSIGLKIDTGKLIDEEEHKKGLETVALISESFNLGEMNVLALEFGLELENITGTTRHEKAVALVSYFMRRGDLDTLIHWCSGKRKNIQWPKTKLDRENFEEDQTKLNEWASGETKDKV